MGLLSINKIIAILLSPRMKISNTRVLRDGHIDLDSLLSVNAARCTRSLLRPCLSEHDVIAPFSNLIDVRKKAMVGL